MNKVDLEGTLVRDVKHFNKMSAFTLKCADEHKHHAYVSVKVFGDLIDELKKLKLANGDHVNVTGSLMTGSYEKDGVKHYTVDVVAKDIYL